LGARDCVPIFSAFDPQNCYPVAPEPRFQGALGFLEDYRPGYEAQVEEFFLKPAATLLSQRFLLGGTGWNEMSLPANVRYVGHVQAEHTYAHRAEGLEAVLTGVCLDHMALPSINGIHGQWIEVVEM